MGLRFPDQILGQCFFVTTTFRNREKLGKIKGFYEFIIKSLDFCIKKYDARLPGYVLMPSHIHLLMVIKGEDLSNFMRDFKKYVAQKVVKDLNIKKSGGIWMPRFDRVAVYTESVFRTKLNYIHNNPVKSGLVEEPEDWQWSSAKEYFSEASGLIEVWKDW